MNFPGASSFDKNLSCVDDVPGSPYLGRAYTVWTNFGGTYANRIVGSYSTNGGATWTTAAPVSPAPASGHHQQGCDVEVGPEGVVYVIWAHCTTNGQNSTEDNLGFAKSTDGGVTWAVAVNNVVDINGIRTSNLTESEPTDFRDWILIKQEVRKTDGYMQHLPKRLLHRQPT